MKRILLTIAVGILLAVLFFIAAAMASGACHCSLPIAIIFPYAAIAWAMRWETVGGALAALQFPLYAILVARAGERKSMLRTALLLAAIHLICGLIAFRLVTNSA
ncbi:MAG TPA: hypothetical protein VKB46_04770 [Pyrinomonadaceae bacterium]|nr:hypothetical protein [Pyrinomonadaceae bacterium]